MLAQLVDRVEPNPPLGELSFDRAVGVERVGEVANGALLEHLDGLSLFAVFLRNP